MRILTLNYEFPPIGGGGSPVSYELARELVAQGHEVDVVTMAFAGLPAHEVVDGINVYRVPCLRRRRELCKTHEMASFVLAALPRVAKLAAARRYDVNHTHFILPTGLLAGLLKTWSGLPFVVTVHGSDVPGYNPDRFGLEHRLLGPMWKWILNAADQVISPSQFLRNLIRRRSPEQPVSIIPNGFRYERFRADRSKDSCILLVSRMLPRKGVQYLLAALPNHDALFAALASYDLVGFQTARDLDRFQSYVRLYGGGRVLGDGVMETGGGRRFRAGAFPISIDTETIARQAAAAASKQAVKRLTDSLTGRALAIGVDRLDYSKGLPDRFRAFERYLERYPDQHG